MSKFAQFGNDLYTGKRSIDFIGRRRTWYLISAIGMVLALAGLGLRGLNLGIEFTGGSEFRVSQVAIASDYEQQAQEAVHSVRPGQGVGVTKLGSDTVLVQTDKLRVESYIPLRFFNRIQPGHDVLIQPEASLAAAFKARVTTVDRLIDSASGTFGVVVNLDNRSSTIPVGSRCKMAFAGVN